MELSATAMQRFFRYTKKGAGLGECWLWTGSLNGSGYGRFAQGLAPSRHVLAHRASWALHRGPIPAGMHVLHTCDVRNCVNPDHLWLGTHQQNMADLAAKGRRSGKGARLTADQVARIKSSTARVSDIAREFGCSTSYISELRAGRYWRHIP